MEAMTHSRRAEIVAEKKSLSSPHRGLAAPDLFLDTMLNQRTCEACPIDYTEALGNIYGNGCLWSWSLMIMTIFFPVIMSAVDVSYVAPQAHKIVNVALHREYPLGIVFIFSQWRKYLYHV
jgi:hypothetical protein